MTRRGVKDRGAEGPRGRFEVEAIAPRSSAVAIASRVEMGP
jgi:hypothetical protein